MLHCYLQKDLLSGGGGVLQKYLPRDDNPLEFFLYGGGVVSCLELEENETVKISTGGLLAYESTVQRNVEIVPGIKNILFSGEGLFFLSMKGPGKIWLQSMSMHRQMNNIMNNIETSLHGSRIIFDTGKEKEGE